MRKDVQFGLTIGGSLAALLIIGVAVFDHGSPKKQEIPVGPASPSGDSAVISTDTMQGTPPPRTDAAPATQPVSVADNTSSTARDWSRLLESGGATTQPAQLAGISAVDVTTNSTTPGATTRPDAVATGAARTHKVAAGETLYTIAAAEYGSSKRFSLIEDANPKINPNKLRVGTVLTIPPLGANTASAGGILSSPVAIPAAAETLAPMSDPAPASDNAAVRETAAAPSDTAPARAAIDTSKSYRVQASDTLMGIARKLYGNGMAWEKIYDANKDAIGPNPARLKVNMVLRLPDAPIAAASAASAN